jgi:hypothetical protein
MIKKSIFEQLNKVWKKNKLNSEKIWKIWKKSQLKSEKIWKLWKKGKLITFLPYFPSYFTIFFSSFQFFSLFNLPEKYVE